MQDHDSELENDQDTTNAEQPSGLTLYWCFLLNVFSEKFCGQIFGHFSDRRKIPHLSVINFMMKLPNPAQKF